MQINWIFQFCQKQYQAKINGYRPTVITITQRPGSSPRHDSKVVIAYINQKKIRPEKVICVSGDLVDPTLIMTATLQFISLNFFSKKTYCHRKKQYEKIINHGPKNFDFFTSGNQKQQHFFVRP